MRSLRRRAKDFRVALRRGPVRLLTPTRRAMDDALPPRCAAGASLLSPPPSCRYGGVAQHLPAWCSCLRCRPVHPQLSSPPPRSDARGSASRGGANALGAALQSQCGSVRHAARHECATGAAGFFPSSTRCSCPSPTPRRPPNSDHDRTHHRRRRRLTIVPPTSNGTRWPTSPAPRPPPCPSPPQLPTLDGRPGDGACGRNAPTRRARRPAQ